MNLENSGEIQETFVTQNQNKLCNNTKSWLFVCLIKEYHLGRTKVEASFSVLFFFFLARHYITSYEGELPEWNGLSPSGSCLCSTPKYKYHGIFLSPRITSLPISVLCPDDWSCIQSILLFPSNYSYNSPFLPSQDALSSLIRQSFQCPPLDPLPGSSLGVFSAILIPFSLTQPATSLTQE